MTTLIISDEEIIDVMNMVQSLEESGLLLKAVCKAMQKEVNKQKGRFLIVLSDSLRSSLLGKLIKGKGVKRPSTSNIPGRGVIRVS